MTVWSSDTGDVREAKKDSYSTSVYHLDNNTLFISSPVTNIRDETAALSFVSAAFPTLDLGPSSEVKVRGQFNMYELDITDYSLVDMILNTELLRHYLYIEETIKSYASKKRLNLRYKSLLGEADEDTPTGEGYITNKSSVSVKLKQKYIAQYGEGSETGEALQELQADGTVKPVSFPVGTPYVEVRITSADSRTIANQFVEVFRRLMDWYRQWRDNVNYYYMNYVPELLPAAEKPREVPKSVPKVGPGAPPRRGGSKKITQLKEVAPDIFIAGYPRLCQLPKQPIAIAPEEIEMWKQRKIIVNDREVERQIMPFPPDNPRVWLVCPDDRYPYPGIKDSDLKNNDQFPYIPCCNKTNHMDPNIRSTSKYNQYIRGIRIEKTKTTKVGHQIKGNKILVSARHGSLPKTINELLTQRIPDNVRWGEPTGVNSLIHCVLDALDWPEYIRLPVTGDDRENYALGIRRRLFEEIDTAVYKQELYDYTSDEIRDQLANPEIFFDPYLYYRGLEELFNINIYTFIPSERDENEETGYLEIPRFKTFHAQPQRDRRTVLIYKHTGGKTTGLPQCELIVSYDEEVKIPTKIFEGEVNDFLYHLMTSVSRVLTCSIENPPETEREDIVNDLVVRSNVYSTVDFFSTIKRSAISQILDDYGKARAFIFPTVKGTFTMAFPPGQPENIPIAQEPVLAASQDVVNVFGPPIGITKNTNDQVDGFWYRAMDILFGVYIPVFPTNNYADLTMGPANPIMSAGIHVVQRIKLLQRSLSILLQIVKWLFVIAQIRAPIDAQGRRVPVLASEFVERYFALYDGEVIDSAAFYDFSAIPQEIRKYPVPVPNSVEEALAWVEEYVPTLVSQGKIIMYNTRFADKVRDQLREFYILTSPLPLDRPGSPREVGSDWIVPTQIEGVLVDAEDFKYQHYVLLFTSENDINAWLKTINLPSYFNIAIKDKLDISYGSLEEAYLYMAPDGKLYMIQNVRDGTFERAINVALTWVQQKINLGSAGLPHVGPLPVYVVYGISTSSTPVVLEDNSKKETVYLQLLRYGSVPVTLRIPKANGEAEIRTETRTIYAAMFPLL